MHVKSLHLLLIVDPDVTVVKLTIPSLNIIALTDLELIIMNIHGDGVLISAIP